jgi:hypothetical protein
MQNSDPCRTVASIEHGCHGTVAPKEQWLRKNSGYHRTCGSCRTSGYCGAEPCAEQWHLFFFLNYFWWNISPYCIYSPLPPLRGQPSAKCHPRWQPILGLAVLCRLGRLLDSNPGLQLHNLVSLPMSHHCSHEPPLLPMSHHCSPLASAEQ